MSIHARHTVPFEIPTSEPAALSIAPDAESFDGTLRHSGGPAEEDAKRHFDQCAREALPAAPAWCCVDTTDHPDPTGIGVLPAEGAGFTARFTLELSSVGSVARANAPAESFMSDAEQAEQARQAGWASLAKSLTSCERRSGTASIRW